MKTDKEMMDIVLNMAKNDERIRLLMQTGSRVDANSIEDIFQSYDFVCGVSDILSIKNDPNFLKPFGPVMLLYERDRIRVEAAQKPEFYSYEFILEDTNKVNMLLLTYNKLQSYMEKETLLKVLIDKDGIINRKLTPSDYSHRIEKPTKYEFENICMEFFLETVEVAKGIYRDQMFYAQQRYGRAHELLGKMIYIYVGSLYEFGISIGTNGKNIKQYLPVNVLDKVVRICPGDDKDSMWATLFNGYMLFRQVGLEAAEKMRYEYPKKEDREVIKYVRSIWKYYTEKM